MPGEELERAIALLKSGQKEAASARLKQLVQAEPGNTAAWLWLAEAMPDDGQRIAVLEVCLKRNPNSPLVQRGLERLRARQSPGPSAPPGKPLPDAPTVPLDSPEPPGVSFPPAPIAPLRRQGLASRLTPSSPNAQAPDDLNALREALTGQSASLPESRQPEDPILDEKIPPPEKTSSPAKPTSTEIPTSPLKPTPAEQPAPAQVDTYATWVVGAPAPDETPAESSDRPQKRRKDVRSKVEPREAERREAARREAALHKAEPRPARRRRLSAGQWAILAFLGLLALGALAGTAYLLGAPLGGWLGLPHRATRTPLGSLPLTQQATTLTPVGTPTPPTPTATITPTPTITPIPTPTATVAHAFSYTVIAPENGAEVVPVGEFASIPALSAAISPDNRLLAAGLDDSTIIVWNLTSGEILYTLKGHTQPVVALAFSPDSRYLVSGSQDANLRIWDVSTGAALNVLSGHSQAVNGVAFSPDGRTIASGSLDGSVDLWQLGSNSPTRSLPAGAPVVSLDFSPDGRLLAAGLKSGAIPVWNVTDASLAITLPGSGGAANSLAFAPNGHRLAVGSADDSVKLWDVDSGKVLYTIGSHTEPVVSVAFSPDGRVLASASQGQAIKLWDVTARREIALLRHARNIMQIAFSPDGRVLAGALSPTNPQSREGGVGLWGILYNPQAAPTPEAIGLDVLQRSKWLPGARMTIAHAGHQAVAISGERILIIGGGVMSDPGSITNKTELYNPSSGASTFTGALNLSRGLFSAVALQDGRVLVVGGYNPTQGYLASAEIYDPVSGSWSLTNPLFNHAVGHTATLLADGRVLVAGGCIWDGPLWRTDRAELFDPATNAWTETSSMTQARCGHSAVLLADGRVLIAGGEAGSSLLNSAELYDPTTGQWSQTGNLITARSQAAALRLADDRVILTGGLAQAASGVAPSDTVEIFNPASGTWQSAASMAQARYEHAAILLPGGLALVAGGLDGLQQNPEQFLTSVEAYNPEADQWTTIASLTVPRAFHTMLLTPEGNIFVMGGMSATGSMLASSELLVEIQPATETPEITLEPEIGITTTPTSTLGTQATPTPTPTSAALGFGLKIVGRVANPTYLLTSGGMRHPVLEMDLKIHPVEGLIYFKTALYLVGYERRAGRPSVI